MLYSKCNLTYFGLFCNFPNFNQDPCFIYLQDEKIQDAEKNQGESELRDALLAKSEYLTKIGQKEEAIESIR